MKVVRIVLSIVLLLVVIAVFALGALYSFVDPNKLKPLLVVEVKNVTGYILSVDGDLSWAFYPRIAVYVPHMTLTEPGETKPFADLYGAKMAADIGQLLHGHGRLQGSMRIADLRLVDLRLSKVETVLHWQDNLLSLSPIKASLYQGSLMGVVDGRFSSKQSIPPHWSWKVILSDVQVRSLLADISPDSKLIMSGVAEVTMQASTQGKSRSEMIVNLNGNTTSRLTEGSIEGVDLNYLVTTADNLINKQPLPEQQALSKTNFNSFTAMATIKNGVANITNVQLVAPAFVTKGQGEIDLLSSSLDIKLRTTPQVQIKTQWDVPIVITGTMMSPQVKLDSDMMARYEIKAQIEKAKNKAHDAIQKHIPGVTGEYLQKLLRR